jgi:hypothetical protein
LDPTLLEVVRKRKETQFSARPGQGLLGTEAGLGLGAATVMGMLQGLGGSPVGMMGMMPGLGGLPAGGLGGMLGAAGVLMGATSADPSTKTLREIHFGNMPPLVSQAMTVLAYSTICFRRHIACPPSAMPPMEQPGGGGWPGLSRVGRGTGAGTRFQGLAEPGDDPGRAGQHAR